MVSNKNIIMSSFKSSRDIQKKEGGQDSCFNACFVVKKSKNMVFVKCISIEEKQKIKHIIIHPILLSNQSAPVAPGDLKIKSHIRTAARHTSLLTK